MSTLAMFPADLTALANTSKATIAKRSKSESDLSDSTCTPKWLADILPHRDVDPCSNERAQPLADLRYHLPLQDGLELPWLGSAFVNWPFSAPLGFARKAQHELREGRCTDLIVLCKMDPSTRWWAEIKRPVPGFALDLWIPEERIQYDEHPDLIEKRRLERLAEAVVEDPAKIEKRRVRRVAKARKAGATDIELAAITGLRDVDGESTANFVSVLFHHRKHDTQPWERFATFAERWNQAITPRPAREWRGVMTLDEINTLITASEAAGHEHVFVSVPRPREPKRFIPRVRVCPGVIGRMVGWADGRAVVDVLVADLKRMVARAVKRGAA